jgi:hypothetical protein
VDESMPDEVTIEELRDLVNEAVWLVEVGGGTDQERAAFRRRKDDLLAKLFPTGDGES